jgi:xylulokinase
MSGKLILAHDLGTTGNKASLYDGEGKVLATAFFAYKTEYTRGNWVEQNPEDWWEAVCTTTHELLATAHVQPEDIAVVAFSGHMMGCVLVDSQTRPLRNAIIWADTRASEETRLLIDAIGMKEAYEITGHRASASYTAAKAMWVRKHQPELFARAFKILNAKDFIVARLTGKFVTDYSDASGTNLYDISTWEWSPKILDAIQLDPCLLPELHASSDVVGHIRGFIARDLGLKEGTPVVIGGGDGACAATGAGVVREGSAYNYIGSSSWIGLAVKKPLLDPEMRTMTFAHLVPGMVTPTGTMQTAGGAYQWLRDVFCGEEKIGAEKLNVSPYDLMNLQVEKSVPGANSLLFLPYLLGERSPRWNSNAKAVYLGLTMQHTRADMIRATMEGITYNLRVIMEAFEGLGANIEAMRVIGGGARGRVWRQIMADIYGKPIMRLQLMEGATSLGAAIAGGVGVGIFKDFGIAEELASVVDVINPNPDLKPLYDRMYTAFNKSYTALVPIYDELTEITQFNLGNHSSES